MAAHPLRRPDLVEIVERKLAPVVGGNLARAAVRAQLDRLGVAGDEIDRAQLAALLVALEKGLRVFVGSTKAATLIADVHAAVQEAERAR